MTARRIGVAALALTLFSSTARSDDRGAALAEALFRQGRDLLKEGHTGEACSKFAESQRIDPKLGTLLNLALCHEKDGKIASAWAEYTSAITIAHRENQREREDYAKERVRALDKRLSHVTIRAHAPVSGLSVTLDALVLETAALGAPLPIDPGAHRITASAPGKAAWASTIDIPSDPRDVNVEVPELAPSASPVETTPRPLVTAQPAPLPPPPVVAPPPASSAPPPPKPPQKTGISPIAIAGFSVAGAGLVVGAATGIAAFAASRPILSACTNGTCPSTEDGPRSTANAVANVSNVSFALAGVGAVVGVVALVAQRPSAQRSAAVELRASPGWVGVKATF